MSQLIIAGDTSGTVTLQAPAVAGTTTLNLPAVTGGTILTTNAGVAPSTVGNVLTSDGTNWTSASKLTFTSSKTLSGLAFVEFTSIPSWARRVTVMFNNVSLGATVGTINHNIQLGTSSGYAVTGYSSGSTSAQTGVGTVTSPTGFIVRNEDGIGSQLYGQYIFTLMDGSIWVGHGGFTDLTGGKRSVTCGGASPALSGSLDKIKIGTVSNVDLHDSGTVNICYE